jgi:peptidoglycan/xylan/chitin deacetylase (PgdA/CDA1 family)
MPARFIIRFDDLCPTLNWDVWERVERAVERWGIRPLAAVVPDNRDPHLAVRSPANDFWDRVRDWQSRGWSIGLHGYQHVYETRSSGILGLNARSEFAGLPLELQWRKLRDALACFASHGVRADVWVAPGHSFDGNTLQALREGGLTIVSDGFYARAVRDADDMSWIPQQLWRFRPMPTGLWTVCYHVNSWGEAELARFERDLEGFRESIISLEDVVSEAVPGMSAWDRAFAGVWRAAVITRRQLAGW